MQTTFSVEEATKSNAIFSADGKYRYKLWRIWNTKKPKCSFIMLNPSKADAFTLDPTVRRCMDYAKQWGYGSLTVGNIFALKSTDPKELYRSDDPVGAGNDQALLEIVKDSDIVITAWGNHGAYLGRGEIIPVVRVESVEDGWLAASSIVRPSEKVWFDVSQIIYFIEGDCFADKKSYKEHLEVVLERSASRKGGIKGAKTH